MSAIDTLGIETGGSGFACCMIRHLLIVLKFIPISSCALREHAAYWIENWVLQMTYLGLYSIFGEQRGLIDDQTFVIFIRAPTLTM
jgi:hypothetical protein